MFSHPDFDLALDHWRRQELRDEMRRLRIGGEQRRPRPVLGSLRGMFDSAIVRLSEGAARRQARREGGEPA